MSLHLTQSIDFTSENMFLANVDSVCATGQDTVLVDSTIYLRITRISGSSGTIGQRTVFIDSGISKECSGCEFTPNPDHLTIKTCYIKKLFIGQIVTRCVVTIEKMFSKNDMYRRKSYNVLSSGAIG